ncbi:MAG: efflux transporter outer membrane subunit [Rubrivivax sp.]
MKFPFLHLPTGTAGDAATPNEGSAAETPRADCPRVAAALATAASALLGAAVLVLGGCANPSGIAPHARLIDPARVGLSGAAAAPSTGTAAVAAAELHPDWWRSFGDTQLDALVTRALADSPSLQVAVARQARAAAVVDSAQAADGPQVNGSADVARQRYSRNSIVPPPLAGSVRTLATLQASASWELDFFGRNRSAIEAAVGTRRAAEAELQAARILIASQVSRSYVQLARLFEQRRVAERTLSQRQEILSLIDQRVRGGLDTNVELRQGQVALPETRLLIEELDEQIVLVRHALAALTAQAPDALASLTPAAASLRPMALPATVPADLLGRRADINAARWRIEAAAADFKVARAQFYPNINLTAFVGLTSIGLDRLLRSSSEQWGVGPALRLPIFDNGRLRAGLSGRAADVDAAIESYNGAVVEAVHDAADQIASLQSLARQQLQQADAEATAEDAYRLATQRYKAGLSTYVTVLNAEASLLNQRRLAADLQARTLDSQIVLARALGGGWQPSDGVAPAAPTQPTSGVL